MIGCRKRFFRLPTRHIAHFQFIMEGHDGIVTVTTVDASAAVLMLCIPDGVEEYVDAVLKILKEENPFPFQEVDRWKGGIRCC